MKRYAEMVLDGHPDKFCDLIADAILGEAQYADPAALGQIEVAVVSDQVWVNGFIATARNALPDIRAVIRQVGRRVGYVRGNWIDASRYRVICEIARRPPVPASLADVPNDQCVAVGWAGYDARTAFLPPEQFAARQLRDALVQACRPGGFLDREGPDGKLLLCMEETTGSFLVRTVIATVQHRQCTPLEVFRERGRSVLQRAYNALRRADPRWAVPWNAVCVLVNPNGPLVAAGSCSDNGQTGRKLIMDYYGPRIPIGGGALSGKSLRHVDRAAAYAARQAAIRAVLRGAGECRVTVAYAPGRTLPVDLSCVCARPPQTPDAYPSSAQFRFPDFCRAWEQSLNFRRVACTADGSHFTDRSLPWNRVDSVGSGSTDGSRDTDPPADGNSTVVTPVRMQLTSADRML